MASLPSKYTTDILVARYFGSYDPATRELLPLLVDFVLILAHILTKFRHSPRTYFPGCGKSQDNEFHWLGIQSDTDLTQV